MAEMTNAQNNIVLDLIAAHKEAKAYDLKIVSVSGKLYAMRADVDTRGMSPREVDESPYTAFIYCKTEVS